MPYGMLVPRSDKLKKMTFEQCDKTKLSYMLYFESSRGLVITFDSNQQEKLLTDYALWKEQKTEIFIINGKNFDLEFSLQFESHHENRIGTVHSVLLRVTYPSFSQNPTEQIILKMDDMTIIHKEIEKAHLEMD